MTTAARPTFDTARGGTQKGEGNLSVLSKQYSAKDLPSHTKLKTRQTGQDTVDEVRSRDFKRDLEDRERTVQREKTKEKSSRSSTGESSSKRSKMEAISTANLDADDPLDNDDSDDSDDEDDTAELLAELQRIKRERAEEIAKKERERRMEEEKIRTENLLAGNPLLNQQSSSSSDFNVKRRWDDDVVFKNCAKDDDKPKNKGFINDVIRSEFHKRFMDKYVK